MAAQSWFGELPRIPIVCAAAGRRGRKVWALWLLVLVVSGCSNPPPPTATPLAAPSEVWKTPPTVAGMLPGSELRETLASHPATAHSLTVFAFEGGWSASSSTPGKIDGISGGSLDAAGRTILPNQCPREQILATLGQPDAQELDASVAVLVKLEHLTYRREPLVYRVQVSQDRLSMVSIQRSTASGPAELPSVAGDSTGYSVDGLSLGLTRDQIRARLGPPGPQCRGEVSAYQNLATLVWFGEKSDARGVLGRTLEKGGKPFAAAGEACADVLKRFDLPPQDGEKAAFEFAGDHIGLSLRVDEKGLVRDFQLVRAWGY